MTVLDDIFHDDPAVVEEHTDVSRTHNTPIAVVFDGDPAPGTRPDVDVALQINAVGGLES